MFPEVSRCQFSFSFTCLGFYQTGNRFCLILMRNVQQRKRSQGEWRLGSSDHLSEPTADTVSPFKPEAILAAEPNKGRIPPWKWLPTGDIQLGLAVLQAATLLLLCGQFQNKANQNVKCIGIGTNLYFTIVNCLMFITSMSCTPSRWRQQSNSWHFNYVETSSGIGTIDCQKWWYSSPHHPSKLECAIQIQASPMLLLCY